MITFSNRTGRVKWENGQKLVLGFNTSPKINLVTCCNKTTTMTILRRLFEDQLGPIEIEIHLVLAFTVPDRNGKSLKSIQDMENI